MFKLFKKHLTILVVFLILIIFSVVLIYRYKNPGQTQNSLNFKQTVATADLLLAPQKGIFYVGDIVNIAVFVSASKQPINMLEGKIIFPKDMLQVIDLSKDNSIISLWIKEPSFSNQDGNVVIVGGLPSPGFVGVTGKIITMSFKVIGEGDATIGIENASLLANDGYGTNILEQVTSANLTLLKPKNNKDIGDINEDGKVNLTDVSIIITNFGTVKNSKSDLDNNGKVDARDLSILLSKWSR